MGIRSSGCAAVDAMDRIRISGNIIPQSWYKEILRDNGKPYLLAVTLLADIVYCGSVYLGLLCRLNVS